MKKTWLTKACSLTVMSFLLISAFSGCGTKDASGQAATSPATQAGSEAAVQEASSQTVSDPIQAELAKGKVNLAMYLVGDAQADQDKVYTEINKLMEKDINTTVTVNNVPWTDVQKKYQLVFASGEEFDCAFAGNFMNYYGLATKNAFMEINEDTLKTYAPATYADLDPYFVKGSRVNGKMYMIPANQHDVRGSLVAIRGDLREKYSLPEIKNVDDFYNYLKAVAKNEKIIAFNTSTDNTSWPDSLFGRYNGISTINSINCLNVKTFDEKLTVYNSMASDEFLTFANKMRELNEAGVFAKNMLSQKTTGKDLFKAGSTASYMEEPNGLYQTVTEVQTAHPEWKIEVYDLSNPDMPLTGLAPSDAGLVLNPKTKHVERTLMMLDLFRENKQYHDLTYLGIEGTHWKDEGELKYTELEASKGFPFNAACPWAWTNDKFKRHDASTPQSLLDIKAKWASMKKDSPILAFAFDDTNVKNEEAALSNIVNKYKNIFYYGFSSDPAKDIEKMSTELKNAGLDKVIQETQTKINEFLANYNK